MVALVSLGLFLSLEIAASRRIQGLREHVQSDLLDLGQRLGVDAKLVRAGRSVQLRAEEVRAGEELHFEAGEFFSVDGVVTSGEGAWQPWASLVERPLSSGSRVVAGGSLLAGRVTVMASKVGSERSLARLEETTKRLSWVSMSRSLSTWGALLVGFASASMLLFRGTSWLEAAALGAIATATLSVGSGGRLLEPLARLGVVAAARRGIVASDASRWEAASSVSVAVFCSRGVVLHGEPEVSEVHVFRDVDEKEVLALAAGAEAAVHHPVANATLRATAARGLVPDASRGHHTYQGLGVICVSSRGASLVVGSRELMLRERISVALAEETLRGLEARGLSTLLVAREGHLIGVLALSDSLRPGARAAFQLCLDASIEPVLLSGDSRATTEALARLLGCEHVRPEIVPSERAREVRRLQENGAPIAVIGTTPRDDVALGASSLSIILDGAALIRGDSPHAHERGLGLTGDSVSEAARALVMAREMKQQLQWTGGSWLITTALSLALLLVGLVPGYVLPLVVSMASLLTWLGPPGVLWKGLSRFRRR